MIIGGIYSFNNGLEVVNRKYPHLLDEINAVISSVDAEAHKTKISKEAMKSKAGKILYSPSSLNKAFAKVFADFGWKNKRVPSEYSSAYYVSSYQRRVTKRGAFRDMDFVKEKLGVEVQFGKYSFMVYNVAAKMTIFRNYDFIDAGVEIVPMAQLVKEMSSGVSYFEQFVWDLEKRGTADIDIPVLILGIDTQFEGVAVPIQKVLDEIGSPDDD